MRIAGAAAQEREPGQQEGEVEEEIEHGTPAAPIGANTRKMPGRA